MDKIMIVEDDPVIQKELGRYLKKHGYEVLSTEESCFLEEVEKEEPNIILLDINLKQNSGFDLCRKLRKKSQVPIIFVTSRDTAQDECKSIALGGDDFIAKPYQLPVLLVHIQAVLRRAEKEPLKEITVQGVTLDLTLSLLRYQDHEVELTKNEFRIVYYFFTHQNVLVSKEELMEYLWNSQWYLDENILNVNIARVRRKLGELGVKDFIQTVHGKGYYIV